MKKKADIAFVQNGSMEKSNKELQALASIYYEPLWVFYNKKQKDIQYIQDLKNLKISIGKDGSGTQDLSLDILNINGINETNTKLYKHDLKKSKQLLENGDIDALFLVTSANSKTIHELLENENIKLMPFKRAMAYSKKFNFLNSITLHEGTIDLYKNIPHENKELLATTATLISNGDFSEELIRLLLKKVKEVHSKKSLFAQENQFPNTSNMNIILNEEANRYFLYGDTFLEKIFPYWIASNIDRLKILLIPLLTLIIPLYKGVFPLYRWSIRSKIYKWYDEVQELDLSLDTSNKEELENNLNKLEELKREIKKEIKVPPAYMAEYYDLIMHIELIISKANIRILNN